MPVNNFQWLTRNPIRWFDVLEVTGYKSAIVYECDIGYPKQLHRLQNYLRFLLEYTTKVTKQREIVNKAFGWIGKIIFVTTWIWNEHFYTNLKLRQYREY